VKGALRIALVLACIALAAAAAAADTAAPQVAITSPEAGVTIAEDTLTIRASFSAAEGAAVEQVELVIDGVCVDARLFEEGQGSGDVAFVWAARRYDAGAHTIAVRATDSGGRTGEAEISVSLRRDPPMLDRGVHIIAPQPGATVSGATTIQVTLDDPALTRYVIFLVDDVFKAMSNVPPFTYSWDTTRYLNGLHTLQAKAYLQGRQECLSRPVEVRVDNPGLAPSPRQAKVRAEATVAAAPMEPPSRAAQPTLPAPKHTASPTRSRAPLTVSQPQVALPGTAPFVAPSGELIRPPSSMVARGRAVAPVHLAAMPTSGEAGPPVAARGAEAPAPAMPAEMPPAPAAPDSAPAVTAASPPPAPMVIAELPQAPAAPAEPARHSPAEIRMEAASAAAIEAGAGAPTPSKVEVAMTPPVPEARAAEAREVEVAMLPPRPVERAPAPRLTAAPRAGEVVYVVQRGDWLRRIAAEFGVSPQEIARANNLGDPSLITPGQQLIIPSASLFFDSQPLITELPTVITGGHATVQFRPVIEGAGGTVRWEPVERRASAVARGHQIAVTIDSDEAQVDGGTVKMSSPAALRCNRTVVPLRFLGDALDLALQYEDGIIHIASGR
jgi:LysM repeat protein